MRGKYLSQALSAAIGHLVVADIDIQLRRYASSEALNLLARHGLRGELVYALPLVLEHSPMLLGYYRLLYGLSQKAFYNKGGFGRFKSMEEAGLLNAKNLAHLDELCLAMATTATELLIGLDEWSHDFIHDLQLLTLGPQFRGAENAQIGVRAAAEVFEMVRCFVADCTVSTDPSRIVIQNAAGREVEIVFAADPDIAVYELTESTRQPKVAIEIKGGMDGSNVHNRIGEAEKSHRKAKGKNFTDFWTIIAAPFDRAMAQSESPTTTLFYEMSGIQTAGTTEYQEFHDRLAVSLGIQRPR
jgi:hypothetical protein